MFRLFLSALFLLTALTSLTLSQTTISTGPVSGTWTPSGSPYLIEGEITIGTPDSLVIEPGVVVDFQGHYKLVVNGRLLAEGTEEDSILFTAADTSVGWHGIRFSDAPDSSRLIFCIVQYGHATEEDTADWGGGIHCVNSNPVIKHCLFRGNTAVVGGAICCFYSHPTIAYCTFTENTATSAGAVAGGIYCWGSNPTIRQCIITGNFGGGIYVYESPNPIIDRCIITWNGGGIYCNTSSPTISNCTISGNSGGDAGGGITCAWGADPVISNCIISENISENVGGGIGSWDSDPIIENCIISGNSTGPIGGGGIYSGYDSNPTIVNVILEGNTGDGAILFNISPNATVAYCDFYDNEGGSFTGNSIPSDLGEIVTINSNGDPCDIFNNIFEDPWFISGPLSDYHLVQDSPCIDAGNPAAQYNDPEDPSNLGYALWPAQGTILNDMGVYGGPGAEDWVVGIKPGNPGTGSVPAIFSLLQNYPNPFNPSTVISYQLPAAGHVYLAVYDIAGREVATIVDGWRAAGVYEVTFDGSELASGMYLYRLTAGEFTGVGKMVLMK